MVLFRGKSRCSTSVDSVHLFAWAALSLLFLSTWAFPAASATKQLTEFGTTVLPLSFAGQTPTKSKIEQELGNNESSKTTTNPPGKSTIAGHRKTVARRTPQPEEFHVTFISEQPGTEIILDGTVVGKTKDDRRLTVKVKKGRYNATTNLKGYEKQSTPLAVFGDATFRLNLGKPIPPPPAPTPTPLPVVSAAPTPEPVAAAPPPSADEIIKRYVDPSQTDKVTVEEWRAVVAQSEQPANSDPTSAQSTARRHLGLGQIAYLQRDFAESVAEFNRAIQALPLSGIAYYSLGNAYLATNQPVEANKAYQRAIELTPDLEALAHKGIGDALSKLHKSKEANSYYSKARDLGYLSPDINKQMALNLMDEKQWQKAAAELEAIESSESAERLLYLGECYEHLKRPLNAYQAYLKATQLEPNRAEAFVKLGDLLLEQRDFPAAKEAYERALALDTTGTKIDRQLVRKRANEAASHAAK